MAGGGAPRRSGAPAGGADHGIRLAPSLSTTCDGGASPTYKSAPHTGNSACRRTRSATLSRVLDPRPRHEPSVCRPRAARWCRTRFRWPTYHLTRCRRAPSASWCRSTQQGGPRNDPYVRTSTTQSGRCWTTWRGTRWKTRKWPPTSSRGGHGDPRGTPRTPRV